MRRQAPAPQWDLSMWQLFVVSVGECEEAGSVYPGPSRGDASSCGRVAHLDLWLLLCLAAPRALCHTAVRHTCTLVFFGPLCSSLTAW